MILKLKPNATKIPTDVYGEPCPDAVAGDILTIIDKLNKTLTVNYLIWRSLQEKELGLATIGEGSYTWTENEVPSVYQDGVLLVPKFGAFDTVFANISIDDHGNTVFGTVGEQWLMLAINPYGDAWGLNWEIVPQ